MSGSDGVLYPMLGVGAFFALFWTGFVLAWEAGLPCVALPLTGLLLGVAGAGVMARLECREERRRAPSPGGAAAEGRSRGDSRAGSARTEPAPRTGLAPAR